MDSDEIEALVDASSVVRAEWSNGQLSVDGWTAVEFIVDLLDGWCEKNGR